MFALLKQSDARQVRKVLSGQREAFGPLVDRYLPAVYAVSYAQVGNHADAEDAVQEAFLSAFQKLHTLQDPRKFEGWVVAIARRAAAALRERKQRDLPTGVETMVESALPDPGRDELRRLLRAEIDRLAPEPREVLLLHYFTGMSAREIAGVLDISREAAKKRLQRARETLSENMLSAIGEEARPAADYRRQGAAIMGLVAVAAVGWSAGRAVPGPSSWHAPATLAKAALCLGGLAAVVGGAVSLTGGRSGMERAGDGAIPPVATHDVPVVREASIPDKSPVPAKATEATLPEQPLAHRGPGIQATGPLTGLWKACGYPALFRKRNPGERQSHNIVYLAHSGSDITLHLPEGVGPGKIETQGLVQDDRISIVAPGEKPAPDAVVGGSRQRHPGSGDPTPESDMILQGEFTDGDEIFVTGTRGSANGVAGLTIDLTLTRLGETEVGEFEIWSRRHEELKALAEALGAYREKQGQSYPTQLAELSPEYLKNSQVAESSPSRLVQYNPAPPTLVRASEYPGDWSQRDILYRTEADILAGWPDFPNFPPLLRVRYTTPPMVLQFENPNASQVRRVDVGNRLRCDILSSIPGATGEIPLLTASCLNNMKQLGLVLKMYQNEARGQRSPAGWATTVPEYLTDTMILTCPALREGEGTERTVSYDLLFPTINERELRALAAQWGLNASDPNVLQSRIPAILEAHPCADGHSRNVLFWDGHAETIDPARWHSDIAPYMPMAEAYREMDEGDLGGRSVRREQKN